MDRGTHGTRTVSVQKSGRAIGTVGGGKVDKAVGTVAVRKSLLVAILACSLRAAVAADAPFSVVGARDLAADGRQRDEPVVILFTRDGCQWCERLKRKHLRHLPQGVVVREVHYESDAPLIDFAGRTTTQRGFAAALKFHFAPTLGFFGPDGQQLVAPIVGVRTADYMDYFIDAALAESRQKLRSH